MDFTVLNEKQRAVAAALNENILLLASAGTGKTNTLAYRIANILEQKLAMPEEILCLTFTNKAAREMQSRIEKIVGEEGALVTVRTFHSFCYDVVKTETKRRLDVYADFIIYDEKDCEDFISELCTAEKIFYTPRNLQSLIGMLKEKRAAYGFFSADLAADYQKTLQKYIADSGDELRQRIRNDSSLFNWWQEHGAAFTVKYDRALQEQHGLDFADLIVKASELLRDDEIALKWSRRFSYINIDEVQDNSELDFSLLERIFGASRLLLAGDYFQTVYEWRGSKPELILERYKAKYKPKVIILDKNYRATKTLLNASFDVLENLFKTRVNTLYPTGIVAATSDVGAPIKLKSAMDINSEAQWIYSTIQSLPTDDYSKICVLTRSNGYNKALSDRFKILGRNAAIGEKIPFMLIDDIKFFRRQEIKDILAFLKIVLNKHDTPSLIRILNQFGRGIGPATIKKITSSEYMKAGIRLTDFLEPSTAKYGDPFALLLDELKNENVVVFDVESTGVDTTRDEIIQIAGIRLDSSGKALDKFVRLIKPNRKVGDSVRVHQMTDDFLRREGEDPKVVLQSFCDFARGAVIVGHNVTYDLKILDSQLARLKLPPLEYKTYYDTLDIYRRFYPNLINHKLEFLGDYFAIEHKSKHDAMDDILATADLLINAVRLNIEPTISERKAKIARYIELFKPVGDSLNTLAAQAKILRPWKLIAQIVIDNKIAEHYSARGELARVENLRQLYSEARLLDDAAITPLDALERFIAYASLSTTDFEKLNKREIPIITIHQAKGSEFDYVFVAGLQEYTFPNKQAIRNNNFSEEERLFYVAITRAKKELFLSWTQYNNGHNQQHSRFINAIPKCYIEYR